MKGFQRRAIFSPQIASLLFQHESQKIHVSSRTFQSKIYPNGPELALEENQNPTVFERLECVARFSGAISATVCRWHLRILLRIPVARILWDFLRGLNPQSLPGAKQPHNFHRKGESCYVLKSLTAIWQFHMKSP